VHKLLFLSLVSLAACSKSKSDPAADKASAKVAEPAAPAADPAAAAPAAPAPTAAKAWVKLAPLPVQLEVANAKVTDQSTGDLKTVGIEAGTAMFSVGLVPTDMKQTLDQIASGAASSGGGEVKVKEKLADGFHVEAQSASGFTTIDIRHTINGKEYSCGTMAPDSDIAKVVREACLSLKAE
jgi:hypothetical protein